MGEYIEREMALSICQREYEEQLRACNYHGETVAWNIGGAIKALPAADVPAVHGHWTKCDGYTECSKCEYWDESPESEDAGDWPNYCPNCGAMMEEAR